MSNMHINVEITIRNTLQVLVCFYSDAILFRRWNNIPQYSGSSRFIIFHSDVEIQLCYLFASSLDLPQREARGPRPPRGARPRAPRGGGEAGRRRGSEGWMARLETLVELEFIEFELFELKFLNLRAFRACPLVEIRQTILHRATRADRISVNSIIPPSERQSLTVSFQMFMFVFAA